MSPDLPLCKDCKYFSEESSAKCRHPASLSHQQVDLVYGGSLYRTCAKMRDATQLCGQIGWFFEASAPTFLQQLQQLKKAFS